MSSLMNVKWSDKAVVKIVEVAHMVLKEEQTRTTWREREAMPKQNDKK